jgi:spore germination protein GerM
VAVVVAAMGVAGAACGVPVDASPRPLPRNAIPFDLLQPNPTTSTSTSTTTPVGVPVKIFFLDAQGHLAPVERNVAAHPPGGELDAVMAAVIQGPTNVEAELYRSAIPTKTRVMRTSEADGVATIDLSANFGELVGPPQIQAVAQIVYSATALPGVHGVAFELDGRPVQVPVASGAEVPVATAAQFASLGHPTSTTTG